MDYSDRTDTSSLPVKDFGKNQHDIDTETMRREVAMSGLCCETRELRLPPKPRVVQIYKSEL
jgi:hypothetical protein